MRLTYRRQFLRDAAFGVAALGANLALSTGWPLALDADPLGLPIGLELYTVRNEMKKDPVGTLKKVAAIGYKEVESSYTDLAKPAVRKALQDYGLSFPSAHFEFSEVKSGWDRRVEEAKELGLAYTVCSYTPPNERRSLDGWKRVADLYNQAGAACQKAGLEFAYHAHNFEFQSFDGVVAFDELLRETDPNLVKIELDCYWVSRAAKDPVHYLKTYSGRFPLLHIKDMKPGHAPTTDINKGADAFTEVGRGMIDWKTIFEAARGQVKHYFVEQDICERPPLESAQISYEYLHNLQVWQEG